MNATPQDKRKPGRPFLPEGIHRAQLSITLSQVTVDRIAAYMVGKKTTRSRVIEEAIANLFDLPVPKQ